jgi:TonB family protein
MMRALAVVGCAVLAARLQGVQEPPLTPGTTAMLVSRVDADYRPLLRQAIDHQDPIVRTIAARVAGVRRQGDMVTALKEALDREKDPSAAVEQSRALRLLARGSAVTPGAALLVSGVPTLRTIPLIAPGMLASLLDATGCKPTKYRSFGAARLTFDEAGVVTHSEVDYSALPAACHAALNTMARLTLLDSGQPATEQRTQYLLLPVDREFVQCSNLRAPETVDGTRRTPKASFTPPKKTHNVVPEYPDESRRRHIEGVVGVTAHVTEAGCVNAAQVVKGLDTPLDFEALRAVVAWRFDPATADGKPMPFVMIVTVSFKLR